MHIQHLHAHPGPEVSTPSCLHRRSKANVQSDSEAKQPGGAHRFIRSMSALPELGNLLRTLACSWTARLWIAVERARASSLTCDASADLMQLIDESISGMRQRANEPACLIMLVTKRKLVRR